MLLITGCKRQVVNDEAAANISAVSESQVSGFVKFIQEKEGVRVTAAISGLSPNQLHGFHIHEKGDCGNNGENAGSHFDPGHTDSHGKPDEKEVHAGDMGNLQADAHGEAVFDQVIRHMSLQTEKASSILGRSVIIHAKKDDFKNPAGNAGHRIGCGVISQ